MAEITLQADTGRPTGSRASNRLRNAGRIPGVVYGQGTEPVAVAVGWRELRQALTTEAGLNALIDLEVDGSSHLTIVKDLQRDPILQTVRHVDFLLISREQEIAVDVPVVLEGEAVELVREEGIVEQVLSALTVLAKPGNFPNDFTIDITDLRLGDTIRVGDLELPPGVTVELDAEEPLVTTSVAAAALVPEEEAGEAAEAPAGEVEEAERAEAPSSGAGAPEGGGGDESGTGNEG